MSVAPAPPPSPSPAPPDPIPGLLERAPRDPGALDAFLAEHAVPHVRGTQATFLFRGEADAVRLRHWIFGLPSSIPFHRVPGSHLWWAELDLPRGSRVEYKLEVAQGPNTRLVRDPLNPLLANDPYGANSVCQGEGYEAPDWAERDPASPEGRLEDVEIESSVHGERRGVTLYLPARLSRVRPARLLVVHDGLDYVRFAGLATVLDNLIARHEIPPTVAVLHQSGNRLEEYAAERTHSDFLVRDVLPQVTGRHPISADPRDRVVMGASFGGVASLACAWHHPGVFGRVLVQSGSFAFTDIGDRPEHRGPVFDPVVRFMKAFRESPGRPTERIYLSCGTYESLIYENRSLVPLLQATGMDVRFREARDGHNWENWRDRLREGLSWLLPGPLLLTYD